MKTKIVYVVASLNDDIYMEQAIVSAWSARYYNPDCQIEMVCDQDTFSTLSSGIRSQYKTLFNNIHVRDFQPEQSMMERSRWLKTTLRNIIEGDYLYLDTDTVVCADLSYVDEFGFDLGMALDQNCEFSYFIFREEVIKRAMRLYSVDISNEPKYFNSGIAYVKDTSTTRDFYGTWHKIWYSKRFEKEGLKDQSALAATNIKHDHLITEMSGDLNCQVMASIQYLHTAKIMHYFNTLFTVKSAINPFYGRMLFDYVKTYGITDDIQYKIINNKSLFISPSMPVPYDVAMLWKHFLSTPTFIRQYEAEIKNSNSYYVISFIRHRFPWLMRINETFLGALLRIFKGKKEDVIY